MPTKHVIEQAEAYLDGRLSPPERKVVEQHLADCQACTRYFFNLRRLRNELGTVMKQTLGNLNPPPALRQQVRQAWQENKNPSRISIFWQISGQTLNVVGTLTLTIFLVGGLLWAIKGISTKPLNLSKVDLPLTRPSPIAMVPTALITQVKPAPSPTTAVKLTTDAPIAYTSLHESLSLPTETPLKPGLAMPMELPNEVNSSPKPTGLLAFTIFDPHQQTYQIQVLNLNDHSQQTLPLEGVSDPALRKTETGYRLAYRAWGKPTRALLSSDLTGQALNQVTHFWEDAAPDWSPIEDRLIFASQRETDRKWRLYTVWGDGKAELNLRREGKSPTFAPDGHRFAFESCDSSHNHCGLWLGSLDNSEYGSTPFLEDGLAKSPAWRPGGEQVAYMANPNDNWDIYLVDSNGQNGQRLTTDGAIDGLPTWSADGQWLAFLSQRGNGWGIWGLHVATGNLQQLIDLHGLTLSPPNQPPFGERSWLDEQLSWVE